MYRAQNRVTDLQLTNKPTSEMQVHFSEPFYQNQWFLVIYVRYFGNLFQVLYKENDDDVVP